MIRKFAAAITLLLCAVGLAHSQSSPGLVYGQVPTAQQWNSYFAAKQDVLGYTPVNRGGDTMAGRLVTTGSTTQRSGLSIYPGVAPAAPNDGDIWTTLGGLYVRIGGGTVGPLGTGSVGSVGLTAPAQFGVTGSPVTGSGTLALAWQNQNANVVLAGPSMGPAAAPTFRALVSADLPNTIVSTNVVNTYTATQSWAKGANVASASTLTVGTDGNFFHVTGTTTINAIATWPAGTTFKLAFDGALQLTHNGTSLILPGGQNITTVAGDTAEFVSEGSGNWRCTIYERNSTVPFNGGALDSVNVYTSNDTWNKPAGLKFIVVEVWGSGGGGGGAPSTSTGEASAGAGGGGGGYSKALISAASLASTVSVTVPVGGTGGVGGAGTSGSTASFGSHVTAGGGIGGSWIAAGSTATTVSGGAGGSAGTVATGTELIRSKGGAAQSAIRQSATAIVSGAGGNSPNGGAGGSGSNSSSSGDTGSAPGGGGGGAINLASQSSRNGGDGGTGRVSVWNYK